MHEKRNPTKESPWTVAARSVAGISESARLRRWRVRGSRCGPCVAHGRPAARRIVCGAAWGQGGRERHGPGAGRGRRSMDRPAPYTLFCFSRPAWAPTEGWIRVSLPPASRGCRVSAGPRPAARCGSCITSTRALDAPL